MVQHRDGGIPDPKQPDRARPETADEPLPEWEELTPEVMEDECRRGDFMMRWALILLAVLLGWCYVTEPSVFLWVRTGQVIASRGGLPPRVDVLSATAEGRPWTNLHWLSDLLLAGIHALAGMPGLTVLCAVTAGLTFYVLQRVNWEQDSTWWPSFCAGLALVAVVPMFQPGAPAISLAGMALLMWLLHRWNAAPGGKLKWQLPLLLAVWGNLDPRAWVGLAVLGAWWAGTFATRLATLKSARSETVTVGIVSLLAGLLVSPWPLGQVFSPWTMLRTIREGRIYSGLQGFGIDLTGPLLRDNRFPVDLFAMMTISLAILALLVTALNRKRLELSWGLMWLAGVGLSFFSREVACMASIVFAACAAINGQQWYRHTFSMDYSIRDLDIFAGRAGRAMSVLALFFLAWLGVNGALLGPQGRRVGLGLDPRWHNRIVSLQKDVLPGTYQDRVYNMVPSQGDVLIWLGYKPFIDSRLALYAEGEEDLVALHLSTGRSVFAGPRPEDVGTDPNAWKATLDRFRIPNVQIRLWGDPGYLSLMRLLIQPDTWQLTALGAAAANYVRVDTDDADLKAYLAAHQARHFVAAAFRPEALPKPAVLTPTWAYAPSTYNQWLIQKLNIVPEAAQLALHYNQIETQLEQNLDAQEVAGLATLAIRNAQRALAENPNDVLSYRVLADSHMLLQQMESAAAVAAGNPPLPPWRTAQVRAAAYNVVKAGGDTPQNLIPIIMFLHRQREVDMCLLFLTLFERVMGEMSQEQWQALGMGDMYLDKDYFREVFKQTEEAIAEARAAGAPKSDLVQLALASHCPLIALDIMKEDLTLAQAPEGKMILAHLLLTCGDLESAWMTMRELEPVVNSKEHPPEAEAFVRQAKSLSGEIRAALLDLEGAIELWKPRPWEQVRRDALNNLMSQPFGSMMPPELEDFWAASITRVTLFALGQEPDQWGLSELRIAITEIQMSKLQEARVRLNNLVEKHPRFSYMGVVRFYLELLEDKTLPLEPPPLKYAMPDVVLEGSATGPPPAEGPATEPPPPELPAELPE